MITGFKKGDLVPQWVLRAQSTELQGEATFGVDVLVDHAPSMTGPVSVSPQQIMGNKDCLVFITSAGSNGNWHGAPTNWMNVPQVFSGLNA